MNVVGHSYYYYEWKSFLTTDNNQNNNSNKSIDLCSPSRSSYTHGSFRKGAILKMQSRKASSWQYSSGFSGWLFTFSSRNRMQRIKAIIPRKAADILQLIARSMQDEWMDSRHSSQMTLCTTGLLSLPSLSSSSTRTDFPQRISDEDFPWQ